MQREELKEVRLSEQQASLVIEEIKVQKSEKQNESLKTPPSQVEAKEDKVVPTEEEMKWVDFDIDFTDMDEGNRDK